MVCTANLAERLLDRLFGKTRIEIPRPSYEQVRRRAARQKAHQIARSVDELLEEWDNRNPMEKQLLGEKHERADN